MKVEDGMSSVNGGREREEEESIGNVGRRGWGQWLKKGVKDMMIGESERYDDRGEWKIWW